MFAVVERFIGFFMQTSMNFHDPRLGTDTPGPGESVFAIRFIGNFDFSMTKQKKTTLEFQRSKFSGQILAVNF